MPKSISTNTFGVAKWVVSPDPTQGTHTTLSAAIASASSGDTIFVRDGTYTENPTLKPGITVSSLPGELTTGNVVVIGEWSFTGIGPCTISNLTLQTNSNYLLSVNGANASVVTIDSCYINCTNNTGINYTSSSASSSITLKNCSGNLSTTGISYFSSSSPGFLSIDNCILGNSGGSVTPSTISAGTVFFDNCSINFPVTTSASGVYLAEYCSIATSNVAALITSGTGTENSIEFVQINSGSAPCFTLGAGTTATVLNSRLNSSNTNAISGLGTLIYGGINFAVSTQFDTGLTLSLNGSTPSNSAAGYVLTSTGTNTTPTWQANGVSAFLLNIQTFTTSGTYTPYNMSGQTMKYCIIELVGGGGGSGGCATTGAGAVSSAAGGGGGGYSRGLFSAATIGVSQAVTIGAGGLAGAVGNNAGGTGGTSSVGTLLQATGGVGGGGSAAGSSVGSAGGTSGVGSLGSVNFYGQQGQNGFGSSTGNLLSGSGGSSYFGGAPTGDQAGAGGPVAGLNYGSGASGGGLVESSAQIGGAAGAPGFVVITEYIT